jgi:hypothetical protein
VIIGYLDPGAGSLVIQAILATALAIPFILRTQIGNAVRRFRGRRSDDPAPRD